MTTIPTDDLYPTDPLPETADEVMAEAYLTAPEGYTLRRVRDRDDTFCLTSPEGMALTMAGVEDSFGDLIGFDWTERERDRDGSTHLVGQGFIEDPEEAVAFAQRWVALTTETKEN